MATSSAIRNSNQFVQSHKDTSHSEAEQTRVPTAISNIGIAKRAQGVRARRESHRVNQQQIRKPSKNKQNFIQQLRAGIAQTHDLIRSSVRPAIDNVQAEPLQEIIPQVVSSCTDMVAAIEDLGGGLTPKQGTSCEQKKVGNSLKAVAPKSPQEIALQEEIAAAQKQILQQISPQIFRGRAVAKTVFAPTVGHRMFLQLVEAELETTVSLIETVECIQTKLRRGVSACQQPQIADGIMQWQARPLDFQFLRTVLQECGDWTTVCTYKCSDGKTLEQAAQSVDQCAQEFGAMTEVKDGEPVQDGMFKDAYEQDKDVVHEQEDAPVKETNPVMDKDCAKSAATKVRVNTVVGKEKVGRGAVRLPRRRKSDKEESKNPALDGAREPEVAAQRDVSAPQRKRQGGNMSAVEDNTEKQLTQIKRTHKQLLSQIRADQQRSLQCVRQAETTSQKSIATQFQTVRNNIDTQADKQKQRVVVAHTQAAEKVQSVTAKLISEMLRLGKDKQATVTQKGTEMAANLRAYACHQDRAIEKIGQEMRDDARQLAAKKIEQTQNWKRAGQIKSALYDMAKETSKAFFVNCVTAQKNCQHDGNHAAREIESQTEQLASSFQNDGTAIEWVNNAQEFCKKSLSLLEEKKEQTVAAIDNTVAESGRAICEQEKAVYVAAASQATAQKRALAERMHSAMGAIVKMTGHAMTQVVDGESTIKQRGVHALPEQWSVATAELPALDLHKDLMMRGKNMLASCQLAAASDFSLLEKSDFSASAKEVEVQCVGRIRNHADAGIDNIQTTITTAESRLRESADLVRDHYSELEEKAIKGLSEINTAGRTQIDAHVTAHKKDKQQVLDDLSIKMKDKADAIRNKNWFVSGLEAVCEVVAVAIMTVAVTVIAVKIVAGLIVLAAPLLAACLVTMGFSSIATVISSLTAPMIVAAITSIASAQVLGASLAFYLGAASIGLAIVTTVDTLEDRTKSVDEKIKAGVKLCFSVMGNKASSAYKKMLHKASSIKVAEQIMPKADGLNSLQGVFSGISSGQAGRQRMGQMFMSPATDSRVSKRLVSKGRSAVKKHVVKRAREFFSNDSLEDSQKVTSDVPKEKQNNIH